MSKFTPKLAGGMAAAIAIATAFASAHATETPLFGGGSTAAEKVYRDLLNQYGSSDSGQLCAGRLINGAAVCPAVGTEINSTVEGVYVGVGSGNGKNGLTGYSGSAYAAGKTADKGVVPSSTDLCAQGTGTGVAPNPPGGNGILVGQCGYYGPGTGSSWVPDTVKGTGPFFPKVTFSGSDDPLSGSYFASTDATFYNDTVAGKGDLANYATYSQGVYDAAQTPPLTTPVQAFGPATQAFGPLLQVPSMIIPMAIILNGSDGNGKPLTPKTTKIPTNGSSSVNLSINTVCGIFNGDITTWNDAAITKDNGNKQLGTGPITVVFREDGSGSTFILSNALLNQCGTGGTNGVANPGGAKTIITHHIPTTWLTANNISTTPTSPATATQSPFFSGDSFFINVGSSLPSTYIANPTLTGYARGANGSSGVVAAVQAVNGAIGYASNDYTKAITSTGPEAANVQSWYTFFAGTTPAYIAPTAQAAQDAMNSTTPPTGANVTNPLNWGVVNPYPNIAAGYPFVGFTFLDLYTCYGDAATVSALASTSTKTPGLLNWMFSAGTLATSPATIIKKNGLAPLTAAWDAAVKSLLVTSKATAIAKAGTKGTACANFPNGA